MPSRLCPLQPTLAPQLREVHSSGRDDLGLPGPAPSGPRAGPVAPSASSGVAAIVASSRAAAPVPGQQTLYQFRPQRLAQMRVSPPPQPPGATEDGAGRTRPPIRGAAMAGGSRAGADAARRLPLGRHASPPPPIPPPPASVASSSPQPPPSPSPSRAMQELLRMWPAPSLPGEDERRGPIASRPPAAPPSPPRSSRSPTAFFNDPEPPMPRQAAGPSRLESHQPPQPPPSLLSQALYHASGGGGDGSGVRRAPPATSLLRAGAGPGGGSSAAAAVLAKLPAPAAFSHLHPSSIAVGGGGGKAPAPMPRFFLAGATPLPEAAHLGGDSGWIAPASSQPQRAANQQQQQQQRPRFAAPTASTEQKQLARRAGHAGAGAAPAPSQQIREGPSAASAALSGPAAAASASGSRPASSGGATEYEPLLHLPQHASLHHNQPQQQPLQQQPQQQPLRPPRPRLRGRGSPGAAARRGPTLDAANRGAAAGRRNGAAEEAAAADWVAGGGAEDDGSSAWDRESSAIGDHFLSEPPLGERSGMSSDADAAAASPEAYSEAASGGVGGAEGGGSLDVSGSADEPTSLQGSPPSNAAGLSAPVAAAAAPPEHASLARFALSQAGAAAGDRLGTSIARWQLYQSAQAGRRGLVRLGERDERTLAVLAAAATAGQAGPQGSGEGVGRIDAVPPAAPSLPRPVFKTASLSTAPPAAPAPPPPAGSSATDAAPAQEAPGALLSRPRAPAASLAAPTTASPGAAVAAPGGGVGVVRASRLAPSGVSATEEMQAALRSLQQSQHLTVAEVQEALDALALGAAAAASAASFSSAGDPSTRKGVPAVPSSLTPAHEDDDAAAAPGTRLEPGEPGGAGPLADPQARLAPHASDASTLLPPRLAPFLQHPPMHAAALATNRASARLPEPLRAAPDRHSLAPPSGGPTDALAGDAASCPRPWHDLVDAYCASQPARRVRGICRLGRCFDAWRALADDRRRLDNAALVVTSAALRTSLQVCTAPVCEGRLPFHAHAPLCRPPSTAGTTSPWPSCTTAAPQPAARCSSGASSRRRTRWSGRWWAPVSLRARAAARCSTLYAPIRFICVPISSGAAFRRFKSLNSAISTWRGAAVGDTPVERSAVLLGAQFWRHRSALRATLHWRARMLACKAARAAADAAAAQVLRCRARGLVIRWRDSAHTRALSRAFFSRNTAATCALVWRVWHARAAQWKARRMANSLAASTYTGRILRSTFASWRGSAVERQQARAAERHCRVAAQRRSLRLWAGWIARVRVQRGRGVSSASRTQTPPSSLLVQSGELSRAGAAAARLASQNARRISLRQWHEAARLQGVLRTATLRRRDEALRGAFERLRAHVVVAQRGRLLKSLVARARGVLPCVAPLLRWRRRARWARTQRAAAALARSWALRRGLSRWVAAVQGARDERRRSEERDERAAALSARAALARVWKRWAGEVRPEWGGEGEGR